MSGSDGEPLQAVLARAIATAIAARELEIRAEAAAAGEAGIARLTLPPVPALSGYLRDWITQRWQPDWGTPWPVGEPGLPLGVAREARDEALRYVAVREARLAVIGVLDQWGRGELEFWQLGDDGTWEPLPPQLRNSLRMLYVQTGLIVALPASPAAARREIRVRQPAPAATPHELEQRPAPGDDDPTQPQQPRVDAAERERRKNSYARFTPKQRDAVLKTFMDSHEGGRDHLFNAYQREIYTTGKGPWLNRENFLRPAKKRKNSVRNKRNPG